MLSLQRQQPTSDKRRDWICAACNRAQHGLFKCQQYRNMSVDDRWAVVRKAGLCFQCLGPHTYRTCKSKKCPLCDKPHHSSLHKSEALNFVCPTPKQLSPHAASYQPSHSFVQHPSSPTDREKRWTKGTEGASTISDHHRAETVSHPPEQRYTSTRGCSYSCTALVVAVHGYHTRLVRLLLDGGSDSLFLHPWLSC